MNFVTEGEGGRRADPAFGTQTAPNHAHFKLENGSLNSKKPLIIKGFSL
ncbi:hypothetical protein N0M98_04315 [Paenibacillus doosanensis]|nr:hypothetical protein [Paenibacillus doosanensis]